MRAIRKKKCTKYSKRDTRSNNDTKSSLKFYIPDFTKDSQKIRNLNHQRDIVAPQPSSCKSMNLYEFV